ncbi:hypothetical protein HCN44_009933 [Aphidius gifuensis]|uniref:Uncharacterized protein n=1 Tax=Aphidius gifuensis TaxID=684658 RepID=A0A834XJG6_APHGI|nr:hypothetical protein HCN44_009933 [Aphidius gifuensis]
MSEESLPSTNGGNEEHVESHGILSKYFKWVRYVSVEPTMWLYMMAFMTTTVIEQSLFSYKACRVDHNLTEEIFSKFHQWNDISGHVVPIILALFLGNWSDRRGRKLPLVIGLTGKAIYSGMVVVNMLQPNWNLNMIVWTATIPSGMLGGDVAIFASCFAYIADVSSHKQRTLRVTILDIAYLSAMPTGIYLGSYLYNKVFDKSYTIMFAINTSLLVLSIIYSLIFLKWQTNERQKPVDTKNIISDFFDKDHVISTFKTITKTRPKFGRLHLWILFIAMILYMFQRAETQMIFLYTQRVFNWDVTANSYFRVYKSSLLIIAMLIVARTLDGVIRDTYIVALGALSHAIGRVLFATAKTTTVFYIGASFAAFGPIVAPTLRSMTSKVVPAHERGKAFAILAVCDNAVPLISSPLYSQLYIKTLNYFPSAIYWLTFATQVSILFLALIIRCTMRSNEEEFEDNENEQSSSDKRTTAQDKTEE